MDINYMNRLENWKIANSKGIPVELSDITEIENNHNITFPLSYRRFLELSGTYCAPVLYGSHRFEYANQNQNEFKEALKEYNLQHLITKPLWVIATLEGVAFWYFYLDEGDNPAVYRLDCESYGEADDKYTYGKVADSFQDWIEQAIENYEANKAFE